MAAISVVHSTREWLPQTQAWLYNQVTCLPPRVVNHVLCQFTLNLDQYAVPQIHSLRDGTLRYYGQMIERRFRRTRPNHLWRSMPSSEQPDVVHSHFGPTGWRDAHWVCDRELAHVVSFYGYDVGLLPRQDQRWSQRYRELFDRATLVLCEGPFMARSIADLGCPEDKIRVQRLGVMTEAIPFRPRRWRRGEPIRVLIAAAFRPKKGITYGLEALGRLHREQPLQITLIGDSDGSRASDAEKRRILATIERHGLAGAVRLRGFRPYQEMFREATAHHVFLAPSVSAEDGDCEGGAPAALIEMAASGMPVVTTRHCDIPEIVRDTDGGLLAGERDVDGLYQRLRWLVEHPGDAEAIAAATRRHIEEHYNARKQGERLASLYESLIR